MSWTRVQQTGRDRCLSCWTKDPERVYLQAGADIDGPVEIDQRDGVITVHDRLIWCEECVKSAFDSLPGQVSYFEDLQRQLQDARTATEQVQGRYFALVEALGAQAVTELEQALADRREREGVPA